MLRSNEGANLMNLAAILMEMAAFAALFTAIVLPAYRGDRKYSAASIHNYPPDIQEEYFKTHERMEVSAFHCDIFVHRCFEGSSSGNLIRSGLDS